VASGTVNENATNPGVTLDSKTRTAIRVLALFSGLPVASLAPTAGVTAIFEHDIAAARAATAGYETTPSAGATAVSFTGGADDAALCGAAIAELEPVGRLRHRHVYPPLLAQ
jgi:hypothetical protein